MTAGSDLTRNNQFNARPTFRGQLQPPASTTSGVFITQYGCLDTDPFGTNEKIIPYGIGTGPTNASLNMRVSKVIGIGPKVESSRAARGGGGGGGGGRRGGGGGGIGPGGLSGSRGGPGRLDQTTSRRYNLTLTAYATNLFNHRTWDHRTALSRRILRQIAVAGRWRLLRRLDRPGTAASFSRQVFNF